MPLPNILKNRRNDGANLDLYILRPAKELKVMDEPPPDTRDQTNQANQANQADLDGVSLDNEAENASGSDRNQDINQKKRDKNQDNPANPEDDPFQFAKIQKEALLRDAQKEVEEYKAQALAAFEAELEERRKAAREDGYRQGFTEGMADAMTQAKIERDKLAAEQIQAVEDFLTAAARARDQLLDNNKEEMKELALAIAEKIIQISLKNSSDIILRMVEAATDTHKKCEWAHIYIADCDLKGKAYTVPELAAALSHISDRVRVIPMADDESGTCIVELPDVIYDASVSTQLSNIKEVLNSTGAD